MYLLNPEKKVSYFGHNFVKNEMKNLFCQSRVSKNKWKVEKRTCSFCIFKSMHIFFCDVNFIWIYFHISEMLCKIEDYLVNA